MRGSLDNEAVEIKCPTCRRTIKKTVSWFKREGQVCPHGCGTTFETKEFQKSIRDCELELGKIQQKLGRINIRF